MNENPAGMNVVIIGSGAASVSAANAIRKNSSDSKISIYTRENIYPYYRPAITKSIAEKAGVTESMLRPDKFYHDNRIDVHTGNEAKSIDLNFKKIIFADNTSVHYDKLLIATGAKCFIPPFPGADLPQVIALREKSDLDRLMVTLGDNPKKVAVIGGGLLGLETAWGLSLLNHEVTVFEALPIILPRQLDPECSMVLENIIRSKSRIKLVKGVCVEEITGKNCVKGIKLKGQDSEIPFDIVIISAGIRSNIGLAIDSGIRAAKGIIVDSRMRTSVEDVYAAGDCAEFDGRIDGIWDTAMEQGKVAGMNIAGQNIEYKPKVPAATLKAFDTKIFSLGDIGHDETANYGHECFKDEALGVYRKFYFRDGKLSGGILFGDVKLSNILSEAVNKSFDIDQVKTSGLL